MELVSSQPEKKPCPPGKDGPILASRGVLAAMFASGKGKQATRHRLAICCAASDCRHLCRWLLKGPGVDDVWCAGGPEKIRLYGALADPNFACPLGRF